MNRILKDKRVRIVMILFFICIAVLLMMKPCYAASDVSGVIKNAWDSAKGQIQSVVDNVVFPVIDLVLAVFFFVKLGTAYFDYRKQGQFEWTAPSILFACLCFTLTAPNYIWSII